MENRKERTKARLRDAMTQLLHEKPFDQITTTELVKVAKISRSGFYTHYQDKYEMIDQYQKTLINTIQYVFEKNDGDLQKTMLETYEFLDNNEIYAALLSENGSKEIHQFMQAKLKSMIEHSIIPRDSRRNNIGRVKFMLRLIMLMLCLVLHRPGFVVNVKKHPKKLPKYSVSLSTD